VQNNNTWILPLSALLGAVAFGVVWFAMPANKKDAPPPIFQPVAVGEPGKVPVVPIKNLFPKPFELDKQERPKQEPAAPRMPRDL
jgi:hypothetical protein